MTVRKRALATAALGTLALSFGSVSTADAAPTDATGSAATSAGVATVDLSPTADQLAGHDIYMGGYGSYKTRGPAEGVSDRPISARALAVRSERESVVFLTIDTTVIGGTVMDAIRHGASEATGIPEDNILVSATHTHGGPDVNGLWGGVSDEYKDQFIARSVSAVDEAAAHMRHATVRSSSIQLPQELIHNRRDLGYTDRALGVLQVRSGEETLATLINFAAHPVILGSDNKLLSSDFVGSLEQEVEARFGGTALFVNGAQGDATPVRPAASSQYEAADRYGAELAEQVALAVQQGTNVSQGLSVRTLDVTLPVQNPGFIGAQQAGLFDGYAEMREEAGAYYFDTSVTRLTLGRGAHAVEMVTVPGEALTNLGLDIRKLIPGQQAFVLGLTHDTLGYFIPEAEWDPAGYEESVSLGEQSGELVRDAVEDLYSSN